MPAPWAPGEFVSVRSQRELLAASVPDTRDAAAILPRLDVDANELALVYRARGVPVDEADRRAREVLGSADPAGSASAAAEVIDEGHEVVGSSVGAAR